MWNCPPTLRWRLAGKILCAVLVCQGWRVEPIPLGPCHELWHQFAKSDLSNSTTCCQRSIWKNRTRRLQYKQIIVDGNPAFDIGKSVLSRKLDLLIVFCGVNLTIGVCAIPWKPQNYYNTCKHKQKHKTTSQCRQNLTFRKIGSPKYDDMFWCKRSICYWEIRSEQEAGLSNLFSVVWNRRSEYVPFLETSKYKIKVQTKA